MDKDYLEMFKASVVISLINKFDNEDGVVSKLVANLVLSGCKIDNIMDALVKTAKELSEEDK